MDLLQCADDGLLAPQEIARALRTTSEEVARSAGLGRDAVQRKQRVRSDETQRRLREMVEILEGRPALRVRGDGSWVGGR